MHQLYIVANSISKLSAVHNSSYSNNNNTSTLMSPIIQNKFSTIRSIAMSGNMCLPLLCVSLCPSIYGHE